MLDQNIIKVLVADDDANWQNRIARPLINEGCKIKYARGYEEVYQLIENDSYDLILLNIELADNKIDKEFPDKATGWLLDWTNLLHEAGKNNINIVTITDMDRTYDAGTLIDKAAEYEKKFILFKDKFDVNEFVAIIKKMINLSNTKKKALQNELSTEMLSKIKKSIQTGDIENAFFHLRQIVTLERISTNLEGQYNTTKSKWKTNKITTEFYQKQIDIIAQSILSLIDINNYDDIDLDFNASDHLTFSSNELDISSQGIKSMKNSIKILHLSDLHLSSNVDPEAVLQPLFSDIEDREDGLGFENLDYIIISGDLTNSAKPEEFEKAVQFVNSIMNRYSVSDDRCIIVPGNHDLDWDQNVYEWKNKRSINLNDLDDGEFIDSDKGILLRRENEIYIQKFKNFSNSFYQQIKTMEYPLSFENQCIPSLFPDHKLLILSANSSWEIDEFFPNRSSIHSGALSRGLSKAEELIKDAKVQGLLDQDDEILKIAVWHHPTTGNEKMIDDSFMERMQQTEFKLCLHGHIHEEKTDLFGYIHPRRKIHISGAGSFETPDRPESIPRLYNLIEISPNHAIIRVHTRCKKKSTGAWTGYAEWKGKERHTKQSFYDIYPNETT